MPSITATLFSGAVALVGHIHVAKTGGSAVNQLLANYYHGVCGHKGYSFDYYQANRRGLENRKPGSVADSVHKLYPGGYDRMRVPTELMFERGFEACRWVSLEAPMNTWRRLGPLLHELHLPCRDPIEHFMSQLNHNRHRLDCRGFQPTDAGRYMIATNRFQLERAPNVSIRCVHFHRQFSVYADTLRLPLKRVVQPLRSAPTNLPRNRSNECIWADTPLQDALRAHLVASYDYYRFCDQCNDWVV